MVLPSSTLPMDFRISTIFAVYYAFDSRRAPCRESDSFSFSQNRSLSDSKSHKRILNTEISDIQHSHDWKEITTLFFQTIYISPYEISSLSVFQVIFQWLKSHPARSSAYSRSKTLNGFFRQHRKDLGNYPWSMRLGVRKPSVAGYWPSELELYN